MESNIRVLTRSKHGLVTGTLRGFAKYYHLNLNRLQFVFLVLALFGVGFFLYFVLWMSVPSYSKRKILIKAQEAKHQEQAAKQSSHRQA